MADIRFAVVVRYEDDTWSVEHLYQHRADAEGCAAARRSQLQQAALVAELDPPLAVSRRADVWAAADWEQRRLWLCAAREQAPRGALACAPIRRGMPVQCGVPQFARAAPAAGRPPARDAERPRPTRAPV